MSTTKKYRRSRKDPVYRSSCDGRLAKTERQKKIDFLSGLARKYLAAHPDFQFCPPPPGFLEQPISLDIFSNSALPLLVMDQKRSVFNKLLVRKLHQSEIKFVGQLVGTEKDVLIEKTSFLPFFGVESLKIVALWMFHNGLLNPRRYVDIKTVELYSIRTGKIKRVSIEKSPLGVRKL